LNALRKQHRIFVAGHNGLVGSAKQGDRRVIFVVSGLDSAQVRAEESEAILTWANAGELRPHVGPAYPLEQAREVMRAKWASRFVGGCVLHP